MKKVSLIIIIIIWLTTVGCKDSNDILTLSTGSVGGTYYPIGASIAQTISSELQDVSINALTGNASVANCQLIGSDEVDFALVQNNVAYWAYEGIASFEEDAIENIRGIASLYPEALQVVTLSSSDITSIYDLENKRVNIGPKDSGANIDALNLLTVYALDITDIEPFYLSLADAVDALSSQDIDAFFITAGYPTVGITELNLEQDIRLIQVEPEQLNTMIDLYPYYSATTIPASTYSSYNEDTVTVTTMAMLVTSATLPENLIYAITKALWDNTDTLALSHVKAQEITIETSLVGMGIPLHEGAKRYYDEQSD